MDIRIEPAGGLFEIIIRHSPNEESSFLLSPRALRGLQQQIHSHLPPLDPVEFGGLEVVEP